MFKKLKHPKALTYIGLGVMAFLFLAMVAGKFWVQSKPSKIKALHNEITELQEKLISAQITSSRLQEVQKLISENMSFSGMDVNSKQSSLAFLRALTDVLDNLGIVLVALEPKAIQREGRFLISPYRLEILGDYEQFANLVVKMEKSPRLISIRGFEVENHAGNRRKMRSEVCRIAMDITTLTLIKEAEWN